MSNVVYKASLGLLLSGLLLAEVHTDLSRAERTLLAGDGDDREVKVGTITGKILFGDPTAEAGAENVGQGALGALSLKAGAQLGDYALECTAESNGAAVFAVYDPQGNRLADAIEGVAYDNGQLAFTIGTDTPTTEFDVGDSFTVTVPKGSGKFVPLSLTAVDGSARVAGISAVNKTAPNGVDVPFVNLERLATVKSTGLIYPAGASDDQKAAIRAALDALSIKTLSAA